MATTAEPRASFSLRQRIIGGVVGGVAGGLVFGAMMAAMGCCPWSLA
jgi:predicted lipid-binding transport protein (Tim44 family)